jgi:hypothetical protein
MMGACGAMAIGVDEWSTKDACIAHWEAAGGGADGYLTDSQATPYLAMMSAKGYRLADEMKLSRADFISACRSGIIRKVEPGYTRIDVDVPSTRRMVCESEEMEVADAADTGRFGSWVSAVKQVLRRLQ